MAGDEVGTVLLKLPDGDGDCHLNRWSGGKSASKGWELVYRSAPDHAIVRIVPGVGITSYVYEHHGTVASVDVHLAR